jgi:hypothetical protein
MMIRNPFSEPNKRGICIALAMITIFWTLMTTGEVYAQKHVNIDLHWSEYLKETGSKCPKEDAKNRKQYLYMWYYIYTSAAGFYHLNEFLGERLPWSVSLYTNQDKVLKTVIENCALYGMFSIAFFIPCIISIACLIIKAIYLSRPNVGGTENNNKKVTNTIIMMTIVFVVCNTINIVIISIAMWYPEWFIKGGSSTMQEKKSSNRPRMSSDDCKSTNLRGFVRDDDVITMFYRTMFAVQQVLPLLNCTMSPMILMWRGSALRRYSKKSFSRVYKEALSLI